VNEDSNITNGSNEIENSEPLSISANDESMDENQVIPDEIVVEKKRKRSEEDDLDIPADETKVADPDKKKRLALKLSVFSKNKELDG